MGSLARAFGHIKLAALVVLAAASATAAGLEKRAGPEAPPVPDLLRIRRLAETGHTTELEEIFASLQRDFEREFQNELASSRAYRVLHFLPHAAATHFDRWRSEHPDSPFALAAAGHLQLGRAWEERGGAPSARTGRDRLAGMRHFASVARGHFEAALALEPRLIPAYEGLIEAGQLLSDRSLARSALDRSLAVDPRLFSTRDRYQATLMRRWGGSAEAIEQVARDAQREAARNPRLTWLLGMDDWDRAFDAIFSDRYAEAARLATRALEAGPHWRFYYVRAWARRLADEPRAALIDLEEANQLHPHEPLILLQQARVLLALGRLDESRAAIELARSLKPHDAHYRWVATQIHREGEWQEFLAKPSPRKALGYAIGFLFRNAIGSLVLLLAVWGGLHLTHRMRAPRDPENDALQQVASTPAPTLHPSDRLGVRIWKVYVWIAALIQVNSFYVRAPSFEGIGGWLDGAAIALSFLGTLAYLHQRRFLSRRFWRVWAPAFPALVVIAHFTVYHAKLYEWPGWGFMHVTLMPIYAALFAYGYRSDALWGNPENPYAEALDALHADAGGVRASDV